ncbi:MAG: ABC transporter permease subunit [Mizugakiibacter sp.]|uniref:ABC transporter permease n=1 Tax=Mizugakiibacter sp. TaxID=1972610 RepID=UPI0031C4A475|nr:ABC transporter permease [Xanthomonadaceae bacterium]
MRPILSIAGKEFRDDFRGRWTLAITGLFAVLALGIAYFGAAAAGRLGFVSFNATLASLTTLAAFVIPLIGLLIAYDTIVGERESGTLALLLSYPLSRAELIAGKFLGHSGVLAVATALGFGAAVVLIQLMTPEARTWSAWRHLGVFVGSASLLGASFAGMACLISALAREKARAAGLALLAWFVLVMLFDLVLLALLVFSGGNAMERALYPYLLLANPIDVFRLVNLVALGAGAGNDVFMSMTAAHAYPPALLVAAMLAWGFGPFLLALLAFRRQEL